MKRSPACLVLGAAALLACEPAPYDDEEPYVPAPAGPLCQGNNDGVIEAAELPFAPGVKARYRVTEGPLEVDLKGRRDEHGVRVWDLTRPEPSGSALVQLAASLPDEHWFAGSFPGVHLVGPLDPSGELLSPLAVDDDGVHLLGLASREEAPPEGTTLVVYDDPVTLYPFPLAEGLREESVSRATNAELYGLPVALEDVYDVEVTGRGTLRLPHLILENTIKLTLRLERTLVVGDARQVTHVFLHECLGEVARVASPATSLDEDIPDDFPAAQSLWRLSL